MTAPKPSQAYAAAMEQTELLGLQRAGAFLSQRQQQHAHSPPMAIPAPRNRVTGAHAMLEFPEESVQPPAAQQDSTASSSFLAAIRRGLHDNSPSWNNNGWFIGDESEEEDDDDDFYTSMMYPYAGGADMAAYAGGCAPAGSFARFADSQGAAPELLDFDLTSSASGSIRREGSLIFAMEV